MNPLLCPAAKRSRQFIIGRMWRPVWFCLTILGCAVMSPTTRATVFDFSAPLNLTAFNGGGPSIMLQVFDNGVIVTTNIIAASAPFDLTVQGGVAAWSSASTAYYYTYEPALRKFIGGTMPLVVAMSKAEPPNATVPPMKFLSAGS